MIVSMTGYGRSLKENGDFQVTVEMRAVNHRFCEINIRMPRQFFFIEDRLKKLIIRYVQRGKVDVFVNLQGEGIVKRNLSVDWNLFDQYLITFEKMTEKHVSSKTFPVDQLLLQEDVVSVQETDDVTESVETMLVDATEEAVQQLKEMRKKEGQSLFNDVKGRLEKISRWAIELKDFAPNVQKNYRERLTKRVEEFVEGKIDVEESRILTEVAVYADKTDIQEELTRIESHLKQFFEILSQAGVVGRKLDFLVQEINREANTIGSKANDITISQRVVDIKAELEKIKEQVQNIE